MLNFSQIKIISNIQSLFNEEHRKFDFNDMLQKRTSIHYILKS
jgi:hypothetical protein